MTKGSRWFRPAILTVLILSAGGGFLWWQNNQVKEQRQQIRYQAVAAFASQDWQNAIPAIERWIEAEPDSGEARVRYANALAMSERFEEALSALESVPSSYDRIMEVRETRLHLLLRDLHRPFACKAACKELLERDPRNETAIGLLIYIHAMLLDLPELDRSLRSAIELAVETPDHYVYLMMQDDFSLMNGPEITAKWLKQQPENLQLQAVHAVHDFSHWTRRVQDDATPENKAKLDAAEQRRDELLVDNPQETVLVRSRVLQLMTEGNLPALTELLNTADDRFKKEAVYLRAVAFAQLGANNNDEAKRAAEAAIDRHPLSFASRSVLSDVLRRQGQRKRAEDVQALAIQGTKIRETISLLNAATDADPALLQRVAEYAQACEDWPTVNGLARRLAPR